MDEIPNWIILICFFTTSLSILTAAYGIVLHILNYRKPFEQRLIVRILLLVPLFAISCYATLISQFLGELITPIREIYEAFVIYCFYKLLIIMLKGERHIMHMTNNRQPINHPFPMNFIFGPIDISDPSDFLSIKRSILQYVWMKPLLLLIVLVSQIFGVYDTSDVSYKSIYLWCGVVYNISISLSLYALAMFWKCLYSDLAVFNPWGKFLCVKMIIFASYWQGLFIGILSYFGIFDNKGDTDNPRSAEFDPGLAIQSALLCVEMIGFAIFHSVSFPYTDFTADKLFGSARVKSIYALRDWISIGDLIYDLKITTIYGDTYNFRNFESMHNEFDTTIRTDDDGQTLMAANPTLNKKIYQGLRISDGGNKKYWIPEMRSKSRSSSVHSSSPVVAVTDKTPLLRNSDGGGRLSIDYGNITLPVDDEGLEEYEMPAYQRDEKLYAYVKKRFISDEKIHYPVEYDYRDIEFSKKVHNMRLSISNETVHDDGNTNNGYTSV